LTAASSPKPITTCCSVLPPKMDMHDAYIGGRFRWTKITRKTSEQQKTYNYIELFGSSTRGH